MDTCSQCWANASKCSLPFYLLGAIGYVNVIGFSLNSVLTVKVNCYVKMVIEAYV